jgi:D-alanyl-D-alanine endopeptidase (penicillin-binding protein 7)
MFKLALGALVSLLFVLTPVTASAKSERGAKVSTVKKSVVKKPQARRREASRADSRVRLVRRVSVVRGKRVVAYRNIRSAHVLAAPLARSAGDVAGLNLTPDPLALASSVALVLDQSNSEVLFEKNAGVALPIASITKLMTGLVVVQAGQDMNEVLTITEDDVDREKHTGSRLKVGARPRSAAIIPAASTPLSRR